MDLAFDLLMGAGIAAGIGIRPFLPVLLVGEAGCAEPSRTMDQMLGAIGL